MNNNKLGSTFSKMFQDVIDQHQYSKRHYKNISNKMTKMKSEMKERRKKFNLIRNK